MKAMQEGVILIYKDDKEPEAMVRKNGSVKYYKLVEMNFADHLDLLGANYENIQRND